LVRLSPKYKSNVNVLAASSGDSVDAITESRHRMLTMRSRRHSGQLSGSLASSLGWGTRMVPFLLRLTFACCGALASWSRSSSVAVPDVRPLAVHAPIA
jgi:hypothetical protein